MGDSGGKVRLVRCPKCENLLPELADYSVYQCGGCGAVLRGMLPFLHQIFASCFVHNVGIGWLVRKLRERWDFYILGHMIHVQTLSHTKVGEFNFKS